jgi:hypothetical protein
MLRPASALVLALVLAAPFGGAQASEPAARGLVPAVEGLLEAYAEPAATPGAQVAQGLRAVALAHGMEVPPLGRCATLTEAVAAHAQRLRIATPALPTGLPPQLEEALGCLLGAVHGANLALDATTKGLTAAEVRRLFAVEEEVPSDLEHVLQGRNHHANLVAAIHMAEAVDRALPLLQSLPTSSSPPLIDLPPILSFAALGNQVYDKNYALQVDLDGDDTYDNHAGGIFLAVGNAFYDVEPGSGTQLGPVAGWKVAAGGNTQDADITLSSSLVLDVLGNDVYGVKKAPMLKDATQNCGTDPRVAIVGSIGSGVLGAAALFDLAGDNTYTQGAGHVFGVGVQYSGAGNDYYEAIRAAQGSGMLGGFGFLIDAGGRDTYLLTAPTGGVFNGDRRFCDADARYGQGGNFDRKDGPFPPQIGVLVDLSGADTYTSPHKSQAFSQGHGFGLLLDVSGNDEYTSGDRSQGAGHGRAVEVVADAPWSGGAGLLIDLAGDDAYTATTMAQGWALGDLLTNPVPPTDISSLLIWTVQRNEALGLLWDQAGADTYSGPAGRTNGATVVDGSLGVFADRA